MKYFGEGLSEKHQSLQKVIRSKDKLTEAKALFCDIHSELHLSQVSSGPPNAVDRLLSDLTPEEYRVMPTAKDETIAWVLWHIARIEDLTMNLLAAQEGQVFNEGWRKRLHSPITDTGNALNDEEILHLSRELIPSELLAYRNAVGVRTRQLISSLDHSALTRRVSEDDLEQVRLAGGVTAQQESAWLLEFWGKKDIAGLLLMPPTRHVMLHLNACCKWKQHIRAGKQCFA